MFGQKEIEVRIFKTILQERWIGFFVLAFFGPLAFYSVYTVLWFLVQGVILTLAKVGIIMSWGLGSISVMVGVMVMLASLFVSYRYLTSAEKTEIIKPLD
jgi:hypothetical protein